jgi:hypothetical protein
MEERMEEKLPQDAPAFKEQTLICIDCEKPFPFTIGEQAFFWSKKLSEPKRCPACRHARKLTLMPTDRYGVRR